MSAIIGGIPPSNPDSVFFPTSIFIFAFEKSSSNLKELDTKLAFLCKDKNYSWVIYIMIQDFDEWQVISCNGDITDFMINILAFSNSIEAKTNFPFRKKLLCITQTQKI